MSVLYCIDYPPGLIHESKMLTVSILYGIDTTHSTPKICSLTLKKYLESKVTQDEIAKTFHISKRTTIRHYP
jgi:hypothetical protein